ncbi:MAG: 16S rRNA (guanine(527)-N(7))-methyltransferase RsmG [Rhizobiales bacterium]|nr:16S rRNA (guanine(527)-N(7))-methyltransferase RsmG [Hyphomicrobiales bacterium]
MAQHMVQVIDSESFSAFYDVSRETMAALETYESLLLKWQKSINLVSNASLDSLWTRHMLDSAQLAALAPADTRRWLDLGSGGGFPGLVVAIMWRERPDFHLHLVESDQRKAIFMREVVRQTAAPASVHVCRIEDFDWPEPQKPRIVSARALAPLDRLLGWAAPFFDPETIGLFLKGQGLSDELTLARKDWIFNQEITSSQSDPSGTILTIRGLHAADRV